MDVLGFLKGIADSLAKSDPNAVLGPSVSLPIAQTGYTIPTPPVGVAESRDMTTAHPELQRRFALFDADFRAETGRQLFITCVWRSCEKQFEYFQVGRVLQGGVWVVVNRAIVKTNIDGMTKKGQHNIFPSRAVDVAIDFDPGPGKHLSWDASAYIPFAHLALKHGLRWGGDWNGNGRTDDEKFVDRPHLELPGEVL